MCFWSADLGPGVGRPELELRPMLTYSLHISHLYSSFRSYLLVFDTYSSIPIALFIFILVVTMLKFYGSSTSAGVPNFLFPCVGVMRATLMHEFLIFYCFTCWNLLFSLGKVIIIMIIIIIIYCVFTYYCVIIIVAAQL